MLTVCVWGSDGLARRAHHTALSAVLKTASFNVQLGSVPHADLHFLLGLDTSSPADVHAADASLRQQLSTAGTSYSVLYGTAASQVEKARAAIERRLQPDPLATHAIPLPLPLPLPLTVPAWVWPCDKCGDAGCEYKLLSSLLTQRALTP